jgi:hypothetical protein
MVKGRLRVLLALIWGVLSASVLTAHDRPLPDQDAFLKETRKHLQPDSTIQSSYMYVETRRELKLDKDGRTMEESVKVSESYPGMPGEPRWERLISRNGQPLSAEELAEQDRERAQQANKLAERLSNEPGKEHARVEQQWQRLRHDRTEVVGDIYNIFDIRMIKRERIEGHDTIAFMLTPKADAAPKTREGEIMTHFTVHAWISETDHELVRLEAEAIDNVPFGLSVLARLHKGASLSFLRRKINGEAWLPARTNYSGSARVGLLWTLRRNVAIEYSDYKKFAADTPSSFHGPQ